MLKFALFLMTAVSIFCAQTTFTVKEGIGVTRANEPVSGGIAFTKGAVASVSQLALFEGASEVPAQFFPLMTHPDGSVQWVLVDFTTALAGNAEKSFTLKTQAPSAAPSPSISVSRSNSVITINNGVLSFSFDTIDFKGVESLVYGGKEMISGAGGVSALDLVKGSADTNGPVTKAGFVYLGDLRATYRVQGELYRGACGGLGYSYIMTVYAGSPKVVIDVSIRNSINADCGRLAKIDRAFASFTLGFDPARTVSYDTLAAYPRYMYSIRSDTIRSTRAYEDNAGSGLAITEKWAGGSYENYLNRNTLSGRKVEVEIIQPIHDTLQYGTAPKSFFSYFEDSASTAATGAAYVYYLLDYSQKSSQIVLQCYDGSLSQSGLRTKMLSMKHRLVPRQASADVAASAGLSIGKFGTLEDEQACHVRWGWQAADPFANKDYWVQEMRYNGREAGKPDCAPWMDIESHYDIEMDYLQGWFLQWVRYGNRDYFDLAEAFGKFYTNHFTWRSTGFEWDGQGHPSSLIDGNSRRTEEAVPCHGMWDGSMYYNLVMSRGDLGWGCCHFFMTGLTDYYCLTGDPDALDACGDACEVSKTILGRYGGGSGPVDTANSQVNLADRTANRLLNYWIRYYELTKEASSLDGLRNYMVGAVRSKKVDPYYWLKSQYYQASWHYGYPGPVGKGCIADTIARYMRANRLGINQQRSDDTYWVVDSVANETWPIYSHAYWMSYWLVDALENWLRLFPGDDDVRDYIIGFANYVTCIKDAYCGLDNYEGVLSDFPRKGMYSALYYVDDTLCLMKFDTAHARCATNSRGQGPYLHSIWNNALVLAVQTAGFRNTGHSYFLKQAERIWGDASCNGAYGSADMQPLFAHLGEWEFYHNDRLTKVVPLFYEALYHTDTLPPEQVTDLTVGRQSGNAGLVFNWSAPAGGAVSYQLKYFQNKPLADWPDYDYSNFDTTKVPWWYGRNVDNEPSPAGAGSPEYFEVSGTFPVDSVFWAAVCTRDTAGNLSRLSNLVRIDNTIGVEARGPVNARFSLCAFPNPFNPAVSLRISLPKEGVQPVVSIYDAGGRLVWNAKVAAGGKKSVNVVWPGRNQAGMPVGSGVYFVKLTAAGKEINRKIVMVR